MSSDIAPIRYSSLLEAELTRLEQILARAPALSDQFPLRWLAIQLLEGDQSLMQDGAFQGMMVDDRIALSEAVAVSEARLRQQYGEDADLAVTDERYQFVHGVVEQVLTAPSQQWSSSDRIDRIVTSRWLGIPIFLALMYLVFSLVQNVSAPYLDFVDGVITGPINAWALALLNALRAPGWLVSLATDGVIAGVGAVLVFVPGLIVMYVSLAVLEDTGYLSRAAFVMDRTMSKMGLHGRSFMPMILGFGCNVPAVYATRSIESRSARLLTGLLIPFMSCSARLPVYVIFGLAFFPRHGSIAIMALYILGVVVAAAVGMTLSRTVFRDAPPGILMMEMPPYRWPSAKRVFRYTRNETGSFVRRAGTFILTGTVVFWLLLNMPAGTTDVQDSWFGKASSAVAPLLSPAGFGEWQASGALVTGLLAKEIVVSTLSQVYVGEVDGPEEDADPPSLVEGITEVVTGFAAATVEAGKQLLDTLTPGVALFADGDSGQEPALATALQSAFTPLSALAFLVFVLLYVPCLATVGAQIQEFGWRWAVLSIAMMLVIPWVMATLIYQGGLLLGFS